MSEGNDDKGIVKQRRDQMLKLVAKGFYNELINYGVRQDEILKVASHLLDNLIAAPNKPGAGPEYYSTLFTLKTVVDEWAARRRIGVQHVALAPMEPDLVPKVADWLKRPGVRESFVPAFPDRLPALRRYFADPSRDYFTILHEDQPVGIVGAENLDPVTGKIEMKKLVGEPGVEGKGIGKRATFGFLYHAFMIRGVNKVYTHSRDINIRNLNLNSRFGFEVEGIFFEEITVGDKRQDVVRMALFKSLWLAIFGQ